MEERPTGCYPWTFGDGDYRAIDPHAAIATIPAVAESTGQIANISEQPESRLPALITILAAIGLYLALPDPLSIGPRWLMAVIAGGLALASLVTFHVHWHRSNIVLGHCTSAVLTGAMINSVILLIIAQIQHSIDATDLLKAAIALWFTNILVFALWYWRLDAGGPIARDAKPGHDQGAFLFPQMTLEGELAKERDGSPWSPRFMDYLFVAFNTSTAFSPTDVPVLSRWAKALCMTQSLISLAIVVLLAARAVNIL